MFAQAHQQRLLLDSFHVESIGFELLPLPPAQPAHSLPRHVLAQHAAPRPALALHPGAHVPPGERHRGQRARADHAAEDGGQ